MPKVVDHAKRRMHLIDAAARLILRSGLSAVTVRAVAAEAGWSTGSLRYYFPDQASLRDYAVASLAARLIEGVSARISAAREAVSTIELVVSVLEELLPFDDQRREEYRLWAALVEWERQSPEHLHSRVWDEQRRLYQWAVGMLASLPDEIDFPQATPALVENWIGYLHVFVDGLAAQMSQTPSRMSVDTASLLLHSFLHEASHALNARSDGCC